MHCYIINLPEKKKRLQRTIAELRTCCPEISWSVPKMSIGAEWTDSEFVALYDSTRARRYFKRDLSRGEVACALSHQAAMRTLLSTADKAAMIVEDDVLLSPRTGIFLGGLELWLNKNQNHPICILLSEAAAVRNWCARPKILDVRLTRPIVAYGAIAYIVNRKGAELILSSNMTPISMTSDQWAFYRKCGLRLVGVNRPLAGSYDYSRSDSSLSKERAEVFARTKVVARKTAFPVRVLCRLNRLINSVFWLLTGVSRSGEVRTNRSVWKLENRKELILEEVYNA